MRYARDERLALCALLDELGPAEPTLCEGWRTVDLAAHLLLRERRPDAAAGVLGGPLARHTASVQAHLARRPFAQLVDLVRMGPPRFSPLAIPGADERVNTVEYFVHHEDVRRAQPGWEPRTLSSGLQDALWDRLPMARLMLRRAPVGVELVRDDLARSADGQQASVRITAKARTPVVTVTGAPAELTMWAMGRTGAARVRLDGSAPDLTALADAGWRH